MTMERVVLRYFPVLGRAEALRHALADRGIAFDDVRIPRGDWARAREDATISGLFRVLPTLSWGEVRVAETLAIASFIAKRSGQYDGLDDGAIARIEAICSCCFLDILMRIAELLRADEYYPGSDPTRAFVLHAPRIMSKLERLEAALGTAQWFGGEHPLTADFFAAEAIETVAYVLGPARQTAFEARAPRLMSLAERVRKRPALAEVYETRPPRMTTRADEEAVVARIRVADLS